MYHVLHGRVGLFLNYGSSDEVKLAELLEDQIFGEMGLLDHAPRTATAVILEEETELETLTEEDARSYFEENPEGKMTALIIGYPDSGKSAIAEKMVTEMSDPDERIYLATMIPYGQEGRNRIERHRKMRAGKGFITIEAPYDIGDALQTAGEEQSFNAGDMTVLLECVSNLAANELFERHTGPAEMIERVYRDIKQISEKVRNLIIVSNHFEIEGSFDDETRMYAKALDDLNEKLSQLADNTIRL